MRTIDKKIKELRRQLSGKSKKQTVTELAWNKDGENCYQESIKHENLAVFGDNSKARKIYYNVQYV